MRIGFIGNFGRGKAVYDGQRIKSVLYRDILRDEGFDVTTFDLEGMRYRPLHIYFSIKRLIRKCDLLLFMASTNGACLLAKMIHRANINNRVPVIYSTIAIGPIRKIISSEEELHHIYEDGQTARRFPKPLQSALESFQAILLEQKATIDIYRRSFGLNNCFWIPNFRDDRALPPVSEKTFGREQLNLVFFARMTKEKGALDLLNATNKANAATHRFNVTFYGKFENSSFENEFNRILKESPYAEYRGALPPSEALKTLAKYDVLCFPSLLGEGVPGSVVESLLAGLPVVTTKFLRYQDVVEDGKTAFVYEPGDDPVFALGKALDRLYENKQALGKMSEACRESAKLYGYTYWRETLLGIFKKHE